MIDRAIMVEELAAVVSEALDAAGIEAVLSGGAAVQIYSEGKYVSKDLDFVTAASNRDIARVLKKIGFYPTPAGRLFAHPETDYLVEFPAWPLAVGGQVIHDWAKWQTTNGAINILTPTQSVQDRLAGYFHWRDPQSFAQAVLVGRYQKIDLDAIRRWAATEGAKDEYIRFERAVRDIGATDSK